MIRNANSIDDALRELFGPQIEVVRRSPVAGGCIANGARLHLSDGHSVFAKTTESLPPQMFAAEADGLEAMVTEGGPRLPRPLALRAVQPGAFLLMEWIDSGQPPTGFHDAFGRRLARMHSELVGDRFGFETDNYIGSTEQQNTLEETWCEFFAARRIGYQARLARDRGRIDSRLSASIDSIINRIGSLLVEPHHPALLHGDLWGGNYLCDTTGSPVLIDPAVYYGHPEADLAMTELFGGFRPAFYRAYDETSPLQPGYSHRRDLYNLYHLLNHLNIFGASYLSGVRSTVAAYR